MHALGEHQPVSGNEKRLFAVGVSLWNYIGKQRMGKILVEKIPKIAGVDFHRDLQFQESSQPAAGRQAEQKRNLQPFERVVEAAQATRLLFLKVGVLTLFLTPPACARLAEVGTWGEGEHQAVAPCVLGDERVHGGLTFEV